MKDKTKTLKIILFGMLFLFGCYLLLYMQSNNCVEEREALCVDGHGDINLEGIMCEKTINTCWDGWILIGLISFLTGLFGAFITITIGDLQ